MPVEKLTVIEGPMAGLGENPGIIDDAKNWMHSHGVSPGLVVFGAVAGAALSVRGDMLAGAVKWALLFGLGSWIYNRCGR